MPNLTTAEVLHEITRYYLDSPDFNGIPANKIADHFGIPWSDLHNIIRELIESELVGVLYADTDLNTHIIRFGFETKAVQISKLGTDDLYHTCIYPRPKHLQSTIDRSRYAGKPYELYLALGEPQLAFRSFDLSVLEIYRNDPRYYYVNTDIDGYICIEDRYNESEEVPEHDQTLLESFGFSYDSDLNRAVAAFIRYLANLSPEHQQIWKAKELSGDYKLHPDYYRASIRGEWWEREPIFTAFCVEMYLLNQMCAAMGRKPIFRSDYGEYGTDKPKRFGFMVRPTLEEYNTFVLLLDKMLSDNIDKEFFNEDVPIESEHLRKDGRVEIRPKGTLVLLDEWLRGRFRTKDWSPWDKSIKTLREIRKLRQKPAHTIDEDVFDQKYFKMQRELIVKAYQAVRTLRMMFENHPAVKLAGIEVPDWLREGKIWDY